MALDAMNRKQLLRAMREEAQRPRRIVLQRIAAARAAYLLAQPFISLPDFLASPRLERTKIRFNYGRQLAPKARRRQAASKGKLIEDAMYMLFAENPRVKERSTTEDIAEKLFIEKERFFPDGIPYTSASTFLQKVRLALARIRPRRRRAS